MNNSTMVFVVEGESREYRFIDELSSSLLTGKKINTKVITLPATMNIYMLYRKLLEDNFDMDIIEFIREVVPSAQKCLEGVSSQEIDEVYLFFDYDVHQKNLPNHENPDEVILSMLRAFDNETENGKLYISYPMVEAIYDYKEGKCDTYTGCYISIDDIKDYKYLSGNDNSNASKHFDYMMWKEVINVFALRTQCLFDIEEMEFEVYREEIMPHTIYKKEQELVDEKKQVFVLSAFPEFILDYFREDFWNANVKLKKINYDECSKL